MKNNAGSDSSQVLALSLFLMLLAFFIVLSTFSDFKEDKVSAVKSSVEETFAPTILSGGGAPSEAEGDAFAKGTGQAFDDIESVLKAQIGLVSITRDAQSGIMTISVPESAVFEDHLSPYSGGKTLASEITAIVKSTEGKNIGFRIEANAHFDKDTLLPQEKIKGLGVFARSMMQKGIDPHALSIGLIDGKAGYVDLIFNSYRRSPTKQELDLAPTEDVGNIAPESDGVTP